MVMIAVMMKMMMMMMMMMAVMVMMMTRKDVCATENLQRMIRTRMLMTTTIGICLSNAFSLLA